MQLLSAARSLLRVLWPRSLRQKVRRHSRLVVALAQALKWTQSRTQRTSSRIHSRLPHRLSATVMV
jgi:predicted membrane chloride channel (bestrophin family)